MSKSVLEYIGNLADHMLASMAELPQIKSVDDLITNMSPKMREKMSIPLSVEFQQAMKVMSAQELEAVRKLREIHLRMSLYNNRLALLSEVIPGEMQLVGKTLVKMQEVAAEQGAELEGAYANSWLYAQASFMKRYFEQGLAEDSNPQAVEAVTSALLSPPEPAAVDEAEEKAEDDPEIEVIYHDEVDPNGYNPDGHRISARRGNDGQQ